MYLFCTTSDSPSTVIFFLQDVFRVECSNILATSLAHRTKLYIHTHILALPYKSNRKYVNNILDFTGCSYGNAIGLFVSTAGRPQLATGRIPPWRPETRCHYRDMLCLYTFDFFCGISNDLEENKWTRPVSGRLSYTRGFGR